MSQEKKESAPVQQSKSTNADVLDSVLRDTVEQLKAGQKAK